MKKQSITSVGAGMKRLLALTAVLGLVVVGGGVAKAQNVLYNGDLDLVGITTQNNPCPLGWVVSAYEHVNGIFYDGGDSETWCSVDQDQPTPDGNDYGFFFKPFQGSTSETAGVQNLIDVFLYQDNPATPGTLYTLSGYPSCQPNYCGVPANNTNSPAVATMFLIEFLDGSGNIISSNATDLFNPPAVGSPPVAQAPISTAGPFTTLTGQIITATVAAPPGTATVRAGAAMVNAYGTSGAQSWFADYFVLTAVAPPGAPIITNQPTAVTISPGQTATFSITVSNAAGVTYQWQQNGSPLSNGGGISGANSATLTITGANSSEVGNYRCLVVNSIGANYSSAVPLALQSLAINPVISIDGNIGDIYRIDYTTSLSSPNWIPLTTNKLTMVPQSFIDATQALSGNRFYRAVYLQ